MYDLFIDLDAKEEQLNFPADGRQSETVSKRLEGHLMKSMERLTIDVPENFVGVVVVKLGPRKREMTNMHDHGYGRLRLKFRLPSRDLIGWRSEFLADMRGAIVMSAFFDG